MDDKAEKAKREGNIRHTIDCCDSWCEALEIPTYSMLVRAFEVMASRASADEQENMANLPNYRMIFDVAKYVKMKEHSLAFYKALSAVEGMNGEKEGPGSLETH